MEDLEERERLSLVVDAVRRDSSKGGDSPDDRADGHGGEEAHCAGEDNILCLMQGQQGDVQDFLGDYERQDSTKQARVARWKE